MNLVCLRIFDNICSTKRVTCHFLNMCLTSGEHSATTECTLNKSDEYDIPGTTVSATLLITLTDWKNEICSIKIQGKE